MTPEQQRFEAYLREREERLRVANEQWAKTFAQVRGWPKHAQRIQPEPTDIVTEGYEVKS